MNFSPLSYVYTLLHRDRKWAKKKKKYSAVHASGTNAFVKATPSPTSMHMWVNKSLHTHIHTNHLGHPFGSSSSSEIQILLLPYHDVHFLPGQLCLVSCLEKKSRVMTYMAWTITTASIQTRCYHRGETESPCPQPEVLKNMWKMSHRYPVEVALNLFQQHSLIQLTTQWVTQAVMQSQIFMTDRGRLQEPRRRIPLSVWLDFRDKSASIRCCTLGLSFI